MTSSRRPNIMLSALLLPALAAAQAHRPGQPSDNQILGKVQTALHDEHAFVGSSILPSVDKGVVTLTGIVRSEAEKSLASADLANIAGIRLVLNNLAVHDNAFHPVPADKLAAGPTGPQRIILPTGTTIPVRLSEEVDTKTAHANDTLRAVTAMPVVQNGFLVLPAGTAVTGRIITARAGNLLNSAQLSIEMMSVRLSSENGPEDIALITQPIVSKPGSKDIDLKPQQLLQFHTAAPLQVRITMVDGKQVLPKPAGQGELQQRSPAQ